MSLLYELTTSNFSNFILEPLHLLLCQNYVKKAPTYNQQMSISRPMFMVPVLPNEGSQILSPQKIMYEIVSNVSDVFDEDCYQFIVKI
jgi:hypothetical protein